MSHDKQNCCTTEQVERKEISPEIGKLALALSQAQGEITGARKDSKNPFFKSYYADLASCWDACRESLAKHKLAVIQTLDNDGDKITVNTILAHESGQYIKSRVSGKPTKNDPQGMGTAITYFRRYSLSAIVGIAQVDDDGNAACRRSEPQKTSADFTEIIDKAKDANDIERIWKANVTEINKLSKQEKDKLINYCKQLKEVFTKK